MVVYRLRPPGVAVGCCVRQSRLCGGMSAASARPAWVEARPPPGAWRTREKGARDGKRKGSRVAVRGRPLCADDDLREAADAPAGSGAFFDPRPAGGGCDMVGICPVLHRLEEKAGQGRGTWRRSGVKPVDSGRLRCEGA